MAKGDVQWTWVTAGSYYTSASGTHSLFGSYSGLSTLNNDEVVKLQIAASASDYNVGFSPGVDHSKGLRIFAAASWVELPPMRAGTASQLLFARINGAGSADWAASVNNVSAMWVIWTRTP